MSRIELIPLYSGSSGNSTLIRAGKRNILIDAGRTCKKISEALNEVGTDPSQIDALFITHSHIDHVAGVDVFVRKYPIEIYATSRTLRGIKRYCSKPHPLSPETAVEHNETVDLGEGVTVSCCGTPHDAAGSSCYKVSYKGHSVTVMTDLGYVTDDIMAFACGSDGILIESNYDKLMLVYGPYPLDLQARIAGSRGHLSNDDCARAIYALIGEGTRRFILGHLSEENNTPDKAYETTVNFLKDKGMNVGEDYALEIAARHHPSTPMEISL